MKREDKKKNDLREAIEDVDKEIAGINKERKKLNEEGGKTDKSLEDYRQFERRLQQKIAKLLEREAALKEKRKGISVEEEKLSERLSKIRRVKTELDEI
jgi:prefoldin subunit 5